MKVHRWNDIRRKKLSVEELEANERWVDQKIVEMNLRALREKVLRGDEDGS